MQHINDAWYRSGYTPAEIEIVSKERSILSWLSKEVSQYLVKISVVTELLVLRPLRSAAHVEKLLVHQKNKYNCYGGKAYSRS